ncbi:MAG: riboflavin biosynthesis protein RibD, partial [Sphingobacteriales bacterium]
NGAGIKKLVDAGIEVTEGVLEKEALDLNKFFFCFHERKRPYIILKWAQSKDGFIARENYEAVKISNEYSNRLVHKMRSEMQAIMVGTNTVLHDNPSLTTRNWSGKNPVRIFIDKQLKAPGKAALFNNEAYTIVLNEIKEEVIDHIHFFRINKEEKLLPQLMNLLFEKNINSLLVEGGSILLQSFVEEGYWDESFIIINDSLQLQQGIKAIEMPASNLIDSFNISTDHIHHYKNNTAGFTTI